MEIFFLIKEIFLKTFYRSVSMSYRCAKSTRDRDTFPLRNWNDSGEMVKLLKEQKDKWRKK